MATLNYGPLDRKVFTPVSSALANLPSGAGTIVALFKKTVLGGIDLNALTDPTPGAWYHGLYIGGTWSDDDGLALMSSTLGAPDDITNWWVIGVDWAAGGPSIERFHWRNQSTLGAWTHDPATGNNGGTRAGPPTTGPGAGWLRLGYMGDNSTGSKDMAICAIWAGTRFADSDYGAWTKTSDLYNHAKGPPTFLCEMNATTLVDLIGGSTFSSANSSGTTLTGADPVNWTMDGIGSAIVLPPRRRIIRPGIVVPSGARFAR